MSWLRKLLTPGPERPAGAVPHVKVFARDAVPGALVRERVRLHEAINSVVPRPHQPLFKAGLHDGVAHSRREEGEAGLRAPVSDREQLVHELAEPRRGAVEVNSAAQRTDDIFLPGPAEQRDGQAEEDAPGRARAAGEDRLPQEDVDDLHAVDLERVLEEDGIDQVVQIVGVSALQKAFHLEGDELLKRHARHVGVAGGGIRVRVLKRECPGIQVKPVERGPA